MYEYFEGILYRAAKIPKHHYKFGQIVADFHKHAINVLPAKKGKPYVFREVKDIEKTIKYLEELDKWHQKVSSKMKKSSEKIPKSFYKETFRTQLHPHHSKSRISAGS